MDKKISSVINHLSKTLVPNSEVLQLVNLI